MHSSYKLFIQHFEFLYLLQQISKISLARLPWVNTSGDKTSRKLCHIFYLILFYANGTDAAILVECKLHPIVGEGHSGDLLETSRSIFVYLCVDVLMVYGCPKTHASYIIGIGPRKERGQGGPKHRSSICSPTPCLVPSSPCFRMPLRAQS